MRTAEFRERLHIPTTSPYDWYKGLLDSHCVQTARGLGPTRESPNAHTYSLSWNERDANWLIRIYEHSKAQPGYYPTNLITHYYQYGQIPASMARCLDRHRREWMPADDQWHSQIQEVAVRLRTYQIMLNTLLKDAMEAGYQPLPSWTDTSFYDKRERKNIVSNTRRREPGA